MDFSKFFEDIDPDNKAIILSLLMLFPVSFIDCWKLSLRFQTIDIIPQIIISAGVAVILTIGGVFTDICCASVVINRKIFLKRSVLGLITPTLLPTIGTILNVWRPSALFFVIYIISSIAVVVAVRSRLRTVCRSDAEDPYTEHKSEAEPEN